MEYFFLKKKGLDVKTKIQKFRITLKFPLLHELHLTEPSESNLLFLKLEIYREFGFCRDFKIEIFPVFKFGEAVLIRTFDLPTLLATKIRAVFFRKWEKTDRKGATLARVKGRDYFDLMWYLEKRVEPNLKCIENIKNKSQLKEELLKTIRKVDPQSIRYDLEALVEDTGFLDDLKDNLKDILAGQLEKW